MNEFEMFMKTHHGVSLARDEARDKYKYGDAQMYWECWNAAQHRVQWILVGCASSRRFSYPLVLSGLVALSYPPPKPLTPSVRLLVPRPCEIDKTSFLFTLDNTRVVRYTNNVVK